LLLAIQGYPLQEHHITLVVVADFHEVILVNKQNTHWLIVWIIEIAKLVRLFKEQAHLSKEGVFAQRCVLESPI
jgi:hypothetical protein